MRFNRSNRFVVAILILLGCTSVGIAATSAYSATVRNDEVVRTNRFDCSDSIYVFTKSDSFDKGTVNPLKATRVRWFNPGGEQVRSRTVPLTRAFDGNYHSWDGITLRAPSSGSMLESIAKFLEPSSGMANSIGRWTVKISLGNRSLPELNFEVLC